LGALLSHEIIRKLYSDPAAPSAFSTLKKLREESKQQQQATTSKTKKKKTKEKSPGEIKAWLETQDSYTLHRPVRKRFPRNPYTVTNIGDVWEADIMDLSSHKKYNDNYKYILQAIDVFSKYLHSVPLLSKTGAAVTSAFKAILQDPRILNLCAGGPYGYAQIRERNFLMRNFGDYSNARGSSSKFVKTPTSSVTLWKGSTERYATKCSGTLLIIIPIGTSTSCQNSCRITMLQYTLLRVWPPQK
jgi:hypothetical protein